jgi:hypothetical protein
MRCGHDLNIEPEPSDNDDTTKRTPQSISKVIAPIVFSYLAGNKDSNLRVLTLGSCGDTQGSGSNFDQILVFWEV